MREAIVCYIYKFAEPLSSDLETDPVETLWILLAASKYQKGVKQSRRNPTPNADNMVEERHETATIPALCTAGEGNLLWRFRQGF